MGTVTDLLAATLAVVRSIGHGASVWPTGPTAPQLAGGRYGVTTTLVPTGAKFQVYRASRSAWRTQPALR